MMNEIGFYIVPSVILIIIVFGLLKNIKAFDVFLEGAKEGLNSTISLAPSLVGLIVAVSMLKSSGALDMLSHAIGPLSEIVGIPKEVVPLCLLRPVSGSGSLALVDNIFKNYGPDSFIGKLASIICGSTETTFYTLTVYFGAVGIKNSRHALAAALMADVTAIIISTLTLNYLSN